MDEEEGDSTAAAPQQVATDHAGQNTRTKNNYGRLAQLMTRHPDVAMFRKFGMLNMLNLLRLQAELHNLEQSLADIWEDDAQSSDENRQGYSSDFRLMRKCKELMDRYLDSDYSDDGSVAFDTTQYDILLNIGDKLHQYNKALEHVLLLDKCGTPLPVDHENLQLWFNNESPFLTGIEAGVWKTENQDDFVAIRPQPAMDLFSNFLNGRLLRVYHAVVGKHSSKKTDDIFRIYSQQKITRIGDGIVAAMSAILPTIAILVLYFIKSMIYRMALVIVFTTVFSFVLATFTNAKKFEVFSATAAFAAIEVVYIGSTSTAN